MLIASLGQNTIYAVDGSNQNGKHVDILFVAKHQNVTFRNIGAPVNNSISAAPLSCFEYPCGPQGSNSQNNKTTTALIGIAFNNASLQDIAKNKEVLKSYFASVLNSLIAKSGLTFTDPCGHGLRTNTNTIICGIISPPHDGESVGR